MQVLRLLASVTAVLAASAAHVNAASSGSGSSSSSTSTKPASVGEETKSLDELYQDALAEGGNLVVYHGGDTPTQQDSVASAFRAAYPKINLTMVVDYSKYHDVRVDNQLARDPNSLVPDVVALQTLQDYPRWKKEGKLLNYKPAGFSNIYQDYVDADGAWISHSTYAFTWFYDTAQLNKSGLPVPKTAEDLADPIYANHIASTYPHDDDAALFVYSQYIDKYGWKWVEKLAANNLIFKRGSNSPTDAVAAEEAAIGVAGSGPYWMSTVNVVKGPGAGTPYLAWGQRMAILKKAQRPAAAKLFVNWIVSKDVQSTVLAGINSRTDVNVYGGTQPWDVPEASMAKFPVFMEDRAKIESLKATLALYFGEVQGKPSPGISGVYPGL